MKKRVEAKWLAAIVVVVLALSALAYSQLASSQSTPYQGIAAALRAGKTVHLVATTYERPQVFATNPTPGPHAVPANYTNELWLTYSGDTVASQCALIRDSGGNVLQRDVYDPATHMLVTTFADGTTEQLPMRTYTLTQVVRGFNMTPGLSVPVGTTTVEQAAPTSRRWVHHFDPTTGEFVGSESWDESSTPVLAGNLKQRMEIVNASPCGASFLATMVPTETIPSTPSPGATLRR